MPFSFPNTIFDKKMGIIFLYQYLLFLMILYNKITILNNIFYGFKKKGRKCYFLALLSKNLPSTTFAYMEDFLKIISFFFNSFKYFIIKYSLYY